MPLFAGVFVSGRAEGGDAGGRVEWKINWRTLERRDD